MSIEQLVDEQDVDVVARFDLAMFGMATLSRNLGLRAYTHTATTAYRHPSPCPCWARFKGFSPANNNSSS